MMMQIVMIVTVMVMMTMMTIGGDGRDDSDVAIGGEHENLSTMAAATWPMLELRGRCFHPLSFIRTIVGFCV